MTQAPAGRRPRRHPRSPLVGFWFTLGWGVAAAAALWAFLELLDTIMGSGLRGARSDGLVLTLPWPFLAVAVVTGVRALAAVGPWRDYRARTTPDQRRRDRADDLSPTRPPVASVIVGALLVVVAVGLVVMALVIGLLRGPGTEGLSFLVAVGAGLATAGSAAVGQYVLDAHYRPYRSAGGAPPRDR